MRNEKVHATLLALVGGFVLYLAYQLLEKYLAGTKEMPDAVFIIAIVVFAIGGISTICYAWICYQRWKRMNQNRKMKRKKRMMRAKNEESGSQIPGLFRKRFLS